MSACQTSPLIAQTIITLDFHRRAQKLSKMDLAKRMRVTEPYVVQVFSGRNSNLTLKQVEKFARALGLYAHTSFSHRREVTR